MKIVGLTYYTGEPEIVLKSDSSLLVNRKPLFVPEYMDDISALPCWVLRVSKLGRSIAPRFAERYYDAVAVGLDFYSPSLLAQMRTEGKSWVEAMAFENSLAVGTWLSCADAEPVQGVWVQQRDGGETVVLSQPLQDMEVILNDAISRISSMLTIRQGDLIYVAHPEVRIPLEKEDVMMVQASGQTQLFCRIK